MSEVAPHRVSARNIDPDADNAIHDDDVARRFGFAGALVPGVELFALASTPLVATWGERFLSGGRLALRFRRPVYDGESLLVRRSDDGALTVEGPDGEVRCVGTGGLDDRPPVVDDLPEAPPAVLSDDPAPGPMGTVVEAGTVQAGIDYLGAIDERLPLYRERSLAHPGLLLRLVNLLLMRNVALGPWVHTASDCRLVAPARLPATFTVRGRVDALEQRGGHDRVRYRAVVLADGLPVLTSDHCAIYRLGTG